MSEYTIETRRRSRSKTPFLRSNCDHEACEHAGEEGHVHHHPHHKKKAATSPNVHTIVEETVEVTSSSHSPSKQQARAKTSDYSSEDVSPENKIKRSNAELHQTQSSSTSSSKTTTTTTTVVTKNKKLGGASTSTPKSNYILESFASQYSTAGTEGGGRQHMQRHKEAEQNEINSEFERSQRAAEIAALSVGGRSKNRSFSRFFGNSFGNNVTAVNDRSDRSVNNGDISDHIAYMEYKRAGEYWKTTPKTDYTYSELSPHRRVLAPGIVAMPNMSRQSLENHHDRINYMIERDPAQEEYIRRRYESSKYTKNRRATEKLLYDSGDEIDSSQLDYYRKKNQYYNGGKYAAQYSDESSWYMRIITTIVTTVSSVWSTLTGGGGADNAYKSALYHTKYANEERGFFGTIAHGISSVFTALLRYVYLFISSILCLDTWLLQSSNAENKGKKRFLLLLLFLLPLLLLAGLFYYLHPNEPFPPKSFSEYTFTLPTLPAIPKIDMSEYLNQENYEALKTQAYNRLDDFRAWTDDYFLYLKTVSQNIAGEGRKLFRRQEDFERI